LVGASEDFSPTTSCCNSPASGLAVSKRRTKPSWQPLAMRAES
jgi:hypothetical protein